MATKKKIEAEYGGKYAEKIEAKMKSKGKGPKGKAPPFGKKKAAC